MMSKLGAFLMSVKNTTKKKNHVAPNYWYVYRCVKIELLLKCKV
jgi:hypothetical protein